MKVDEAVDAYVAALVAQRYAAKTIHSYTDLARRFAHWLAGEGVEAITDVTAALVARYQESLIHQTSQYGRPFSSSYRSSVMSVVRGLFDHLVRHEHVLVDPTRHLTPMRQSPRQLTTSIPSEREIERLITAPDVKTRIGIRDRAVLELLYASGLRNAELRALAVLDVDLADETLTVRRGKGQKSRVVPLGREASRWIARYLERVRPEWARRGRSRATALFLSTRGAAMDPGVLRWMVRKYAKRAGIARRPTVHLLRHACATHMLLGGADIRYVQQLLGHRNLATTSIYTHLEIGHLKRVHRRCHPRARRPSSRSKQGADSRRQH